MTKQAIIYTVLGVCAFTAAFVALVIATPTPSRRYSDNPGVTSVAVKSPEVSPERTERRAAFTSECENIFLDIGYDVHCFVDDGELVIAGDKMSRVVTHNTRRLLIPAARAAGFTTVKFCDGSFIGGYSETFDLTPPRGE